MADTKKNVVEQTFSKDVKEEIATNLGELSKEDATMFLAGFIKQTGSLIFMDGKMGMQVQTANAVVARRVFQLLRAHFYDIRIEITVRQMVKLNRQSMYVLKIHDETKSFFREIFFFGEDGFTYNIPEQCIDKPEVLSYYMQGLFLGAGSINNLHQQSYHLEITVENEHFARQVIEELAKYNLMFKYVKRRNLYVVYLKDSTMIGDFLAFIRAMNARFAFEDVRISRDMMNSMNRLINCEIANEQKTQAASSKQVQNILFVLRKLGKEHFTDKEKQVIDMRVLHQEASMNELAQLLQTEGLQISKSGINHILRKISTEAKKLRESEKEDEE